jgi:hypothetical protein
VRRAALALLLFTAGCTSAAEAAYREDVACLSQYPEGVVQPAPACCELPGRTVARITAERDYFRARAIEQGRTVGKGPADVAADARAFHGTIVGPDAHPSEERMERLGNFCATRLRI